MIMGEEKQNKWYFRIDTLVIAFLCVGPLALPLVWFNPRFSMVTKTVITVIVIILSYYLGVLLAASIKAIIEYYQFIFK
ncbi:MAG: hypothetical protein ABSB18_07190 [Candidatus Omnitrophota bacterium]